MGSISYKMNVRSILSLLKRSEVKPPLGRWTVHNKRETSLKIKYANEDNCGVSCLSKISHDDKYIYMMGFETAHK